MSPARTSGSGRCCPIGRSRRTRRARVRVSSTSGLSARVVVELLAASACRRMGASAARSTAHPRAPTTIRAKVADMALLSGLQAELLRTETVAYITEQLTRALRELSDRRPARLEEITRARAAADQKLRNLIENFARILEQNSDRSTTDRLHQRSAGRRTFTVDLPATHPDRAGGERHAERRTPARRSLLGSRSERPGHPHCGWFGWRLAPRLSKPLVVYGRKAIGNPTLATGIPRTNALGLRSAYSLGDRE